LEIELNDGEVDTARRTAIGKLYYGNLVLLTVFDYQELYRDTP